MKRALFLAMILWTSVGWAQGTNQDSLRSFRRSTAIVLFSGVGGGILGLSTLSFYGEPREHTENITVGALVGALAGAGYVIWESSEPEPQQPKNVWSLSAPNGVTTLNYIANF